MASFGKRRPKPGPSKNEQKALRTERARLAALLKDRYPSLQRLTIQLEFLTPQKQSFDRQKRELSPDSVCDLSVPCPGCNSGSFDLAAKVQAVIVAHEALSESGGICQERAFAEAKAICGFELRCRIEALYKA
ncbi:MAG: hypothetical protein HY549_11510 [Elusimicrobia bacterium]|nr:hypothetical protein [Elusimicrobiota bacterium]